MNSVYKKIGKRRKNWLPYTKNFKNIEIGDFIIGENLLEIMVSNGVDINDKGDFAVWKVKKFKDINHEKIAISSGIKTPNINCLFSEKRMNHMEIMGEIVKDEPSIPLPQGFYARLYILKKPSTFVEKVYWALEM